MDRYQIAGLFKDSPTFLSQGIATNIQHQEGGTTMKINCVNCENVPICYLYLKVTEGLDKTHIIREPVAVLAIMAESCKSYKPFPDE